MTVYKDGSLEVSDDGRGMPIDIHPKEKVSGVELILTRLHAGGKFSEGTYKFSGGLHGVGVSVVNALSKHLECWVRRGGKEYNISFRNGKVHSKLEVVGDVGKTNTGTTVRFWPDPAYFDSPELSLPKLKHVLKAKAVLCPGLQRAPHGREERREGGVAVHGRARAVPARIARLRRMAAGRSRSSAASRASRKASTGPSSGARTAGRGSRKATSTSSRRSRAART